MARSRLFFDRQWDVAGSVLAKAREIGGNHLRTFQRAEDRPAPPSWEGCVICLEHGIFRDVL